MRHALPALLVVLTSFAHAQVDSGNSSDALPWLKKIATASRQLNYAGTFVYQHDNRVETSRIAHYVDATGEYERLETLDGPAREVIRNNNKVTCYLPDTRTIVIEERVRSRFPALVSEQWTGIAENYTVKKSDQDRVAGFDCQVIVLEPRDNMRYGHKFCVELVSGLPLRARMYNDKNEMVESFAFTQLRIGGSVTKDLLKSRYAGKSQTWRVDRSALEKSAPTFESHWVVKNHPAGFKKVTEMKRSNSSGAGQISHIVYSDGLAAVSVFIEPLPKPAPPGGPSYQGAVNVFVKTHADQMVTVMGETPARTVRQIAESLQFGSR